MHLKRIGFATAVAVLALLLGACEGDDGNDGATGALGAPGADGSDGSDGADGQDANAALSLKLVGSTPAIAENFDESAAEIVAYHAASDRPFLATSTRVSSASWV